MKQHFSIRGYVMILLSAVLFGSYGIWAKILGTDFGIYYQAWTRSALVMLVMIPLMIITKSYKKIHKKDWKWITVSVLFGVFTQVPIYYAFNHTSIGTATLIFYAMFVITSYVVGRIFLGETITKVKIVAILLAIVGLVLTFGLSLAEFSAIALALAAINGIASGGEVSTTKKSTNEYSSLMVSNAIWFGIFITHLPMSLLTHEKQLMPAMNAQWFAMLGYAAAGLAGFWLVVEAYKFVDASIGSLIGLMEIVFGIFFGILFFHEHLTLTVVLGALFIITAGMLPDLQTIWQHKRTKTNSGPIREM